MTPEQKEAFRREVLEEAAKMIDVMETASFDSYVKSWGRNRAAAIRALAASQPAPLDAKSENKRALEAGVARPPVASCTYCSGTGADLYDGASSDCEVCNGRGFIFAGALEWKDDNIRGLPCQSAESEFGTYEVYTGSGEAYLSGVRLKKGRAKIAAQTDYEERLAAAYTGQVVAWMHPEAGWSHREYETVNAHCRKGGPYPVPLFTHPAPLDAERVRWEKGLIGLVRSAAEDMLSAGHQWRIDPKHLLNLCDIADRAAPLDAERVREDERDRLYEEAYDRISTRCNEEGYFSNVCEFMSDEGAMPPADRAALRQKEGGE